MSTRRIPDPGFAGDQGAADPTLERALALCRRDPGRLPEVLAALHGARVLAPVVARLGESGTTPDGLRRDKSSDIAVPLLVGEDGRRALPVFSGLATLARWDPQARPVPVEGRRAARVALAESAQALVVDVAGPCTAVLEDAEVRALAEGRGTVAPYDDAALVSALAEQLAAEPLVTGARLRPQPRADARLVVEVAPSAEPEERAALARRLSGRLGRLDVLRAAVVRGLDLVVESPGSRARSTPARETPASPGRQVFSRRSLRRPRP